MRYNYSNGVNVERNNSILAAVIAVASAGLFAIATFMNPASAATSSVYNSVPSPLPVSNPSLGFEAQQTAEFGAKVQFAAGERTFDNVKVIMNSWACETGQWEQGNCLTTPGETFTQELTLNIYTETAGVLTEVKSVTQTFKIPYRPSANQDCPINTETGTFTRWKDATTGSCQNGMNTPVVFNLNGITLPDEVVYGIEYNTFAWGYQKKGVTGPYDALNVSVVDPATSAPGVTVATYRAFGTNPVFEQDNGYTNFYAPAVQFNAVDPTPPAPTNPITKDDCKNGNWATFNTPAFKNQGQCVASVTSNKNAN